MVYLENDLCTLKNNMYSAAAGWLDGMFLNVCSFDLAYGSSRVSWLIFSLHEFDEIITMMRVGC